MTGATEYTASALRTAMGNFADESRRAEAEMREHMAAAHGASGGRLEVIRAYVELASCRARRARTWERYCSLVLDKLDEEPEEAGVDAGG